MVWRSWPGLYTRKSLFYSLPERRIDIKNHNPKTVAILNPTTPSTGKPKRKGPESD
jgi:hypothetical protein